MNPDCLRMADDGGGSKKTDQVEDSMSLLNRLRFVVPSIADRSQLHASGICSVMMPMTRSRHGEVYRSRLK